MTNEDKLLSLKSQIELIKDPKVKEMTEFLVTKLPDKFFTAPASSSGKHHPEACRGVGGLLIHTKMAVNYAVELSTIYSHRISELDLDHIYSAIILHDGCKFGKSGEFDKTQFDHPLLMSEFIIESVKSIPNFDILMFNHAINVANLVLCHMGQWNETPGSPIILKKPESITERFVHECDYLASRYNKIMEF